MNDPVDIPTLKGWFESYITHTAANRAQAERDLDYVSGNQWTSEERDILARRGQPVVVDNIIKKQIDGLIGKIAAEKRSPVAQPNVGADPQAAEAVTHALSYVARGSDMDMVRTSVALDALVMGHGGAVIYTEEYNGKAEVCIKHVPWDRLAADVHSRRMDFRDATWKAVSQWMPLSEAKAKWPDAAGELDEMSQEGPSVTSGDTFADKPLYGWIDRSQKRINVVEMYWKDGKKWMAATFAGAVTLVEPGPSKFTDEHGIPVCPIEMVACYRDRDLNTFGVVRNMVSLQDLVNKSRSKMMHLLNSDQFIYQDGVVDDIETLKHQVARPDGAIKINASGQIGDSFVFRDRKAEVGQHAQLMADARAQLLTIGTNAAMTGDLGDRASGDMVREQQMAGENEMSQVRQALECWELNVYRQVWGRIRNTWTAERWIRVTKDDSTTYFVALNRPVTPRAKLQEQGMVPPPGLEGDPRLDMPMVENDISELDVDLTLETVKSASSVQEKTFQDILAMAASQGLPLDILVEFHPDPQVRQRILAKLRPSPEEQQAQQQAQAQEAQVQQMMLQAQMQMIAADTVKKQAEAQRLIADKELKEVQALKTGAEAAGYPTGD